MSKLLIIVLSFCRSEKHLGRIKCSQIGLTYKIWTGTKNFATCKRTRHQLDFSAFALLFTEISVIHTAEISVKSSAKVEESSLGRCVKLHVHKIVTQRVDSVKFFTVIFGTTIFEDLFMNKIKPFTCNICGFET